MGPGSRKVGGRNEFGSVAVHALARDKARDAREGSGRGRRRARKSKNGRGHTPRGGMAEREIARVQRAQKYPARGGQTNQDVEGHGGHGKESKNEDKKEEQTGTRTEAPGNAV